jgi:hypothetical protein
LAPTHHGRRSTTPNNKLSNYNVVKNNGTLTVTKADLTVTADNKSKVYGAANPTFTASYSGFVNGDAAASLGGTLGFDTNATASSPVGSYDVTPKGLTSNNYNITFAKGTLSVTKAPLTVTADNKSKVYGAANPTVQRLLRWFRKRRRRCQPWRHARLRHERHGC